MSINVFTGVFQLLATMAVVNEALTKQADFHVRKGFDLGTHHLNFDAIGTWYPGQPLPNGVTAVAHLNCFNELVKLLSEIQSKSESDDTLYFELPGGSGYYSVKVVLALVS